MSEIAGKPKYTPPQAIDLSSMGVSGYGILGVCETGNNPVPGNACKTGLGYVGNCGTGLTPGTTCISGNSPTV
jgi:hypothetical protein